MAGVHTARLVVTCVPSTMRNAWIVGSCALLAYRLPVANTLQLGLEPAATMRHVSAWLTSGLAQLLKFGVHDKLVCRHCEESLQACRISLGPGAIMARSLQLENLTGYCHPHCLPPNVWRGQQPDQIAGFHQLSRHEQVLLLQPS